MTTITKKVTNTLAGALLAAAGAIGAAQAQDAEAAPEAAPRVTPPTIDSCLADLEDPQIETEEYIFGRTGTGLVTHIFGYVAPAPDAAEDEPRAYTGCVYYTVNERDPRVHAHEDLESDRGLRRFNSLLQNAQSRDARERARIEAAANAVDTSNMTQRERRCLRAQQDLAQFEARINEDGQISRQEQLGLNRRVGVVANYCPQ